jgi:hypothetical protein
MRAGKWMQCCVVVASVCGPVTALAGDSGTSAAKPSCSREPLTTVGSKQVWWNSGKTAFFYGGGLAIDADGAPNAYHPDNKGLDYLANAGKPGNWWGIVTDNGKPSGQPVVQGASDPYPGYYVSATSLEDQSQPVKSPARYVDSGKVPYVVLPPQVMAPKTSGGAKLGDFAAVVNTGTGKVVYAIVADRGPKDKIGEGSIALADGLGIASNPKKGGTSNGVAYVIFPGSGNRKPRSVDEINKEGERLLEAFGGSAQLTACVDVK